MGANRWRKWGRFSLATLALLGIVSSRARAGNDDSLLIGGLASITGGAVTATVGDGSAAWYNPAGLAKAPEQTFDINASAYGINRYTGTNFFTLPDGSQGDAKFLNWQLIPTALSYVRRLNAKWNASFSVFIPYTTDADLRTSLTESNGRTWIFGQDQWRNEYDYVIGAGMRLNDKVRWGFSVNGIYISAETMQQVGAGRPDMPGTPFLSYSMHKTLGDYGLRVGLGLQIQATKDLEIGVALQSPTLTALRKTNLTQMVGVYDGGPNQGSYQSSSEQNLKGVWELSTPLRVRAGAAWTLGRTQLMLDGSIFSPLDSDEKELRRKRVLNLRAATLITLSDTLAVGMGAFTDFNDEDTAGTDFVGVSGGVRMASNFHIVEGGRALSFVTTLGLRYAYGWGSTEGFQLVEQSNTLSVTDTKAKLQVHEMALYLGGGVAF